MVLPRAAKIYNGLWVERAFGVLLVLLMMPFKNLHPSALKTNESPSPAFHFTQCPTVGKPARGTGRQSSSTAMVHPPNAWLSVVD